MPVTLSYPGVYVQEAPNQSHVISGVTTADTAFVDIFTRGPVNTPTKITNFGEFQSTFGGLSKTSRASYGIAQFFLNGGATAYVVRVATKDALSASVKLKEFTLTAIGPGIWANNLDAATQTSADGTGIDLVVREVIPASSPQQNPVVANSEIYRGLSLDPSNSKYVVDVLQHESSLVIASNPGKPGAGGKPPAQADSITSGANAGNPAFKGFTQFKGGKDDSALTDAATLIGVPADPENEVEATGMYTLHRIAPNVFNLLCLPAMSTFDSGPWGDAFSAAFAYCEKQRAFFIVDPPWNTWVDAKEGKQVQQVKQWFTGVTNQTDHAAVYFPSLKVPDPLAQSRPANAEASGTMAGIYARTDAARGVWKAPAGTLATLTNATPVVEIPDSDNGDLNELGINAVRSFPVVGTVSWGARTVRGADELEDQWKYVNVRRLANYIELSLLQGTTWAVFEPNDHTLWAALRLSVGVFMDGLYKQGAFAGTQAKDCYFVACDETTTTPADQEAGIVNVNVGFSPLYPAEFVVITLSQMTAT